MKSSYRTFHYRKVLPLASVVLVLTLGLVVFVKNEALIQNFKPHYYKSYIAAAKYKVSRAVNTLIGRDHLSAQNESSAYTTSIPVLLYHGVIVGHPDGTNVSLDSFISHMLILKSNGYNTISLQDYYDFINYGKKIPKKSFLLTFDDGRKDSYYPTEPILRALGYRATMFVITGKSFSEDSQYYLSKEELITMRNSGRWDIQAHTRDGHSPYPIDKYNSGHFYVNKLWINEENRFETDTEFQQRIRNDLSGAKDDIMHHLGIKSLAFAYPFGDIGEGQSNYPNASRVLIDETEKAYPLAFYQFHTTRGYAQSYIGTQTFLNRRINILQNWTAEDVLESITHSSAKPLPFSIKPSSSDGWLATWANTYFTNEGLLLSASSKTTGAAVNLDGTYGWDNYSVSTELKLLKGSALKLLLRFQDNNNYVACSYGNGRIQLHEVTNGETTIRKGQIVDLDLTKYTTITATANKNVVTCVVPGRASISANLADPRLSRQGGIGFVVADTKINNAEGVIKYIEVNEVTGTD